MKRYLEKHIKKDLTEKIVLLSGPRQVGKTTMIQARIEKLSMLKSGYGTWSWLFLTNSIKKRNGGPG